MNVNNNYNKNDDTSDVLSDDNVSQENAKTLFADKRTTSVHNHMVVFVIENANNKYNNGNDAIVNSQHVEKATKEQEESIKLAIPDVTIDKEIVLTGPLIRLHSIVKRQYSLIHFYACDAEPSKIKASCPIQQMFEQEYGVTWDEVTRAGRVINAFNMLSLLPNCTPLTLYEMWMMSVVESEHGAMQMTDGCYVVQISLNAMQHHIHSVNKANNISSLINNSNTTNTTNTVECKKDKDDVYFYDKLYLINGFYPYEVACLHRSTTRVRCWQISWPEEKMNWNIARNVIYECFHEEFGQDAKHDTVTSKTNKSKHEVCSHNTPWHLHSDGSKDIKDYVELEENYFDCYFNKSNVFSLCNPRVHCSASPLEAMRERHIWFNANYENDALVKLCKVHGLSCALLLKWISNPLVSRSSFVNAIRKVVKSGNNNSNELVSTSISEKGKSVGKHYQKDEREEEYERVFHLLENVQTSTLIEIVCSQEQQQQEQKQENANISQTCMNNMHNHALVLLHPTCTNEDTITYVLETLAKQNITVTEHHDCFTQHAQEIVCQSTSMKELCQWASCDRDALCRLFTQLHASALDTKFTEQFHISLQTLLDDNKVFSACAFCASFHIGADELMSKWEDAHSIRLQRGCYIVYMREFDVFVINGFVPYLWEVYHKPGARWHYFHISWPEAEQSWAEVSQLVIGQRDIANSSAQSIQRVLSEKWREFHLECRPCYRAQCCVSISHNPFAAAMERVKWHCMSEHYNLMHYNTRYGTSVDYSRSNNDKFAFTHNPMESNEITLEHFYAEPFVQRLLISHVPIALITHYAYKYTQNYDNMKITLHDDVRDVEEMWYEQTREEIKQLFAWQQSSVCLRQVSSIARRMHRCCTRNYSFIYLYGSCSNSEELVHDMMITFIQNGIVVESHGSTPMSHVSSHHLLDLTYSELYKNAITRRACEIPLSYSQLQLFELSFHMSWHTAVRLSLIINASEAVKKFGEHELITKWNNASAKVCLSPESLYVAYFAEDGLYVVNGFYYYKQARLYHSGNISNINNNSTIKWFCVSFPQVALSYHSFLQNIVGDEDPAQSSASSLRGMLWRHWQTKYHLTQPPDSIDNGMYVSHSSLEAMSARCRWLQLSPLQDTLGYLMYIYGIDAGLLHKITCNPLVYFVPLLPQETSPTIENAWELETHTQSELANKNASLVKQSKYNKSTKQAITTNVIDNDDFMCEVCDLHSRYSFSVDSKSQHDEVVCNAHISDTNRVIELLKSWQDSYNFVLLKEHTVLVSPNYTFSEDEDKVNNNNTHQDTTEENKDNGFYILQNMKNDKLISRALCNASFYTAKMNAQQLELLLSTITSTTKTNMQTPPKSINDATFHNSNTHLQTVLTIDSSYIPSSRVCDVLINFVQDVFLRHGVDVLVCGRVTNDIARNRMIFDTQYKTAWHYATQRNALLSLLFSCDSSSELIQLSCEAAFGEKINPQNVYTAFDMMHQFHFTAHAVNELWRYCAPIIEVAPDVFIGKVPHESCYLVNGFMPYAREQFYNISGTNSNNNTKSAEYAFLLLKWRSSSMSYATFVREVIGQRGKTCSTEKMNTTAEIINNNNNNNKNRKEESKCRKESEISMQFRRISSLNSLLKCNWRQLGMSGAPDDYMTPIEPSFTSLSALQSMQLRQLWWPVPLHLDPLTWNNLRNTTATNYTQQQLKEIEDNEKDNVENNLMTDAESNNYHTTTESENTSTPQRDKTESIINTLNNINTGKYCHHTHPTVNSFIVRCALSNPLVSALPHSTESINHSHLLSYLHGADNATTLSFLSSLSPCNTTMTSDNTSPLRNVAFMVIQPHLSSQVFRNDITEILNKHHINIDEEGVISGSVMRERHGTRCLHFTYAAYASVHNPALLYLTEAEEDVIYRTFHVTWQVMLLTETVLGAYDALCRLGHITPQTLYQQWRSLPRSQHVMLRNGTLELCKLQESDFYVINAPYPALQECYEAVHAELHWYSISWSQEEMSWKEMQHRVIGERLSYKDDCNMENENSHNTETICGLVKEHWHARYGLPMSPDDVFTGVHVSKSALHALLEENKLLQRPVEEQYLGQELLCRCSSLHSTLQLQSIISINSPLIVQCTNAHNTQKQTLYEWMEKQPNASQAVEIVTRIAESMRNQEHQTNRIHNDTISKNCVLPIEMMEHNSDDLKCMSNGTNDKINIEVDVCNDLKSKENGAPTNINITKRGECCLLPMEECKDEEVEPVVVVLEGDNEAGNAHSCDANAEHTLPFMNIANITAIFVTPTLSQSPSSQENQSKSRHEIQNEQQEHIRTTLRGEKVTLQKTQIMERIVLMLKEIQSINSLRIIGRYAHQEQQQHQCTERILKHLLSTHFTEAFYALHPDLQHYLSQYKTSEITASDIFQQQFAQTFHEKWNDIIDEVRSHKESSSESLEQPSVLSCEQVEHQEFSSSSISKNNVSNYYISCGEEEEEEATSFAKEQPTRVMSAWMAMQTYHLTARELYELTCMNDGIVMWFDHCFTIHKLQHDNWDVYVVNAHFLFALQQTIAKLHLQDDEHIHNIVHNNQEKCDTNGKYGGKKEQNMSENINSQDVVHTAPSMTAAKTATMMMFTVEWDSRECDWDTFCNLFARCDCNRNTNDICEEENHINSSSDTTNKNITSISHQPDVKQDINTSHLEYLEELRKLMSMANYLHVSDGPLQAMIERQVWHWLDGGNTTQDKHKTMYTKNDGNNTTNCKINAQLQQHSKTPVLPDKLLRNVINCNWNNLLNSAINMNTTNIEASKEKIQQEIDMLCDAQANIQAEEVTEMLQRWIHNPLMDATADFELNTNNKENAVGKDEISKENDNTETTPNENDDESNMEQTDSTNCSTIAITRRRVFDIFHQQNSECVLQMVCRYLLHRRQNSSVHDDGNSLPCEVTVIHEQQTEEDIYDFVLRNVVNNQSRIVELTEFLELAPCSNKLQPDWKVEADKIDNKIMTINALTANHAHQTNGYETNEQQQSKCTVAAKKENSFQVNTNTADKSREINDDTNVTNRSNITAATAPGITCKFRKRLTSAVVKDLLMNAHSSEQVHALWQYYCAKERQHASTCDKGDAIEVNKDNSYDFNTIDFQEFKRDFVQLESYGVPLLSPQIIAIFNEIEVGRKRGMKTKQKPNRMNYNEFARVLAFYNSM